MALCSEFRRVKNSQAFFGFRLSLPVKSESFFANFSFSTPVRSSLSNSAMPHRVPSHQFLNHAMVILALVAGIRLSQSLVYPSPASRKNFADSSGGVGLM